MYLRNGRRGGVITAIAALTVFVFMVCLGATANIGQLATLRASMQNAAEMGALAGAHAARELPADEAWLIAATLFRDNLTGGARTVRVKLVSVLTSPSTPPSPYGAVYSCGPFQVKVWYLPADERTVALGADAQEFVCVEAELWSHVSLFSRKREKIKIAQAKALAVVPASGLENQALLAQLVPGQATAGSQR